MKIGYARVSTFDQQLDLQIGALEAAGCERIYRDCISGTERTRPGLSAAIRALKRGDTIVVWKLDRIGRSLGHIVTLCERLQRRGVLFSSITEGLDTSSATGLLIVHILGAIAQFEKSLIKERTLAGLAAARAKGRQLGRRPCLTAEQRAEVRRSVSSGLELPADLAVRFNVHPRTIRRCLQENVDGGRKNPTGTAS